MRAISYHTPRYLSRENPVTGVNAGELLAKACENIIAVIDKESTHVLIGTFIY
jgi:hypothetical protein